MASAPTEIKVTEQIAAEHGLSAEEFARVKQILGRDPNITELGIFSVMWSEHCSYKSSKVHLKRLPTHGKLVVQGPGENAGVVDIGDGLVAAFKIESHNHPSYVEPFQGATTGVGGILRDIFTMGARPIAILDSLRFGPITPDGLVDARSSGASLVGATLGSPAGGASPAHTTDIAREFSSSEYSKTVGRIVSGEPPAIDLAAEKRLIDCLVAFASASLVQSAHDISDGGLAVALAESCFAAASAVGAQHVAPHLGTQPEPGATSVGAGLAPPALGASVSLNDSLPAEFPLFSERGARAIVSLSPTNLAAVLGTARQYGVAAREIGTVTSDNAFRIEHRGRAVIESSVDALRDIWANSLERTLGCR